MHRHLLVPVNWILFAAVVGLEAVGLDVVGREALGLLPQFQSSERQKNRKYFPSLMSSGLFSGANILDCVLVLYCWDCKGK